MKKLGFLLMLLSLSLSYGYSASKIVKGIKFEGNLRGKKPDGKGKLIISTNSPKGICTISGHFEDNTIKYAILKDDNTKVSIFGDFNYSINKKENNISLELNDVSIYSSKVGDLEISNYEFRNVNLGKIVIGHKDKLTGVLSPEYREVNAILTNFSSCPLSIMELTGENTCSTPVKLKITFNPIAITLNRDNSEGIWEFQDGSEIKYSEMKYNGWYRRECIYTTGVGDLINCGVEGISDKEWRNWDFYLCDSKPSKIVMKDKSVMNITKWYSEKNDAHFSTNLEFPDGGKFEGKVILYNSLNQKNRDINLIKYIRGLTAEDIEFYDGTYTDNKGEKINYKDGNKELKEEQRIKNSVLSEQINFALLGIPIGGTVSSFNTRLKKEGCEYLRKDKELSIHEFKGIVMGKNAYIYVYYDEVTNLVYKVKARIHNNYLSLWYDVVKTANEKYKAALDQDRSSAMDGYSPINVYSNSKNTLIIDADENPNSTYYINLTYLNNDNVLRKLKSDLSIPSINLTGKKFIAAYKNRGKRLKYSANIYYSTIDLFGLKCDFNVESDGNDQIEKVVFKPSYYHANISDLKDYVDIIRNGLDQIYSNADKRNDGLYRLGNMKISIYTVDHAYSPDSPVIEFIKEIPKRAGGDI